MLAGFGDGQRATGNSMAAVETAPAPLDLQFSQELPATAGYQDGRPAETGPFTSTPEREYEEMRRRDSAESSAGLAAPPAAAGAGHGSGPGCCRTVSSSEASTSTPARSSAYIQTDPKPVDRGVEDILRSYLITWGQRLVQLQPKVHMNEHLTECGLHLFKYLRQLQMQACCDGKFPMQYLSNEQLLIHDLVACWWLALKHCSVRTAVPNRTLMCRATSASSELLADREVAALVAMDWRVHGVLKHSGLVI